MRGQAAVLTLAIIVLVAFASSAEGKLNVHVVPHTHDDVGWLKTVDQYYTGANNTIQHAAVQYILDSVIQALALNPERKFVYVEQAFFQRWYRQQTPQIQDLTKKFVSTGQLEFINGAWCMHDEAATHYIDMIDQTTLGHRFIKDEFGVIPTIGWQIDPFGHSATQASLLSAEVGFEALYFGRIDYQDHDIRMANKEMEFVWRASPSLGEAAQIFSGAFQSGNYGPPSGFCFDQFCDDAEPIQDDPELEDYNVERRVNEFVKVIEEQASHTIGNEIMITMGSDFQFENANEWFKNMDKLIKHVNADGRLNMFYSTPSIYTKAKNAEGITWNVKTDDFFPYADCEHCMWTGYFTSRPALKRYVRHASAILQTSRHFEIFNNGDGSATETLYRAQSVAQHHDGVSGTSKQHVAYDYAKRIARGTNLVDTMVANVIQKMIGNNDVAFNSCYNTINISFCTTTQDATGSFVVFLYNPLVRERTELVTLPISNTNVEVFDDTNSRITSQVTPVMLTNAMNAKSAQHNINFLAKVPALGFSTYFVQPKPSKRVELMSTEQELQSEHVSTAVPTNEPITIGNEYISLTFGTDGYLASATDVQSGTTIDVHQDYSWYASYLDPYGGQNSGAYIFRPNSTDTYPVGTSVKTEFVNGAVVQEVHQVFCDWITQIVRVTQGIPYAEFIYTVGSIPTDGMIGKEVISRFTTNLATKGKLYTDSNGREVLERIRDYRPTWNYTVKEPIAGNYYPMNAFSSITDGTMTLTLLNDRAQGVASIRDGEMEVMVHRRTFGDDARGVGEPIDETESITPYPNPRRIGKGLVITGTHYLVFSKSTVASSLYRELQNRIYFPFHQSYASLPPGQVTNYIAQHTTNNSFTTTSLPINVDLTTFQSTSDGSILIRLTHQFEIGEHAKYSQPVTIDLQSLFTRTIIGITEVTLTATQSVSEVKARMQWKTNDHVSNMGTLDSIKLPMKGTSVTLGPMQIRTFRIGFKNDETWFD